MKSKAQMRNAPSIPHHMRDHRNSRRKFDTHTNKVTNSKLFTYFETVKHKIFGENSTQLKQFNTSNLNINERKTLTQLMKMTDIIINKADKGSTIVIQDRENYIKESEQHLNNINVYLPRTSRRHH